MFVCFMFIGSSDDSDFGSDSSVDSVLTDRTFIPDNESNYSDISSLSVLTSPSSRSRESTPTAWDEEEGEERRQALKEELQEELRFLRDCTPLREMTPVPGVTVAIEEPDGES